MNKNIGSNDDFDAYRYSVGEQPRKSTLRKNKKLETFDNVDDEFDGIENNRHSYSHIYKRKANKNIVRMKLRDEKSIF